MLFGGLIAAIVSSYFSVVVTRGFRKSLVDASHCDFCGKPLAWKDKLPVISAAKILFFQHGKTACCGKRLPKTYFITELLAFFVGVLATYKLYNYVVSYPAFTISGLNFTTLGVSFIWVVLVGLFLYMAIDDLWNYQIDTYLLVAFACTLLLGSVFYPNHMTLLLAGNNPLASSSLLTALVAGLIVLLLIVASNGKGLGVGDVFMVALIGSSLGLKGSVISLQLTIYSAAVVGLLYAGLKKKYKGLIIPLVPFLFLGWLLYLCFPESFLLLWPEISYS